MRVWRICPRRFASNALSGIGGLHASARWHREGNAIVYTAATPSLAVLEYLVHFDSDVMPEESVLLKIDIPSDVLHETVDPESLTPRWKEINPPSILQDFGTAWLTSLRSCVLAVRSVIVDIEANYLLNPSHPDMPRIRIVDKTPFAFDPRLLER